MAVKNRGVANYGFFVQLINLCLVTDILVQDQNMSPPKQKTLPSNSDFPLKLQYNFSKVMHFIWSLDVIKSFVLIYSSYIEKQKRLKIAKVHSVTHVTISSHT